MSKKPFTTRIDEEVLAVAQRLADSERRSVTSLIEIAVLDYAARRGVPPAPQDETPAQRVSPQDGALIDSPKIKAAQPKRPEPKPSVTSGGTGRGKPRSR
jgi:hypothetical protein